MIGFLPFQSNLAEPLVSTLAAVPNLSKYVFAKSYRLVCLRTSVSSSMRSMAFICAISEHELMVGTGGCLRHSNVAFTVSPTEISAASMGHSGTVLAETTRAQQHLMN